MKTIIKLFSLFLMFTISSSVYSQAKKLDTIRIKTSAECDQCKKSIEKALLYEKGIKSAKLDVDSKVVEVVYKPAKTNPEHIRHVITNIGYDADDQKANNKAYQKLEDCCKKGGMDHK